MLYKTDQKPGEGVKQNTRTDTLLRGTLPSMLTLRFARARNLLMRLANRGTPLQDREMRRHVRRREERVCGLRMRMRVLRRGKVHNQGRVLRRRGQRCARREVRERR
jgi:hypothetical protein